MTNGNWNFFLQFWRKLAGIKDHLDFMNDFQLSGKIKKPAWKTWAFGAKMKKILKNFNKNLRFFDQNLYGKLTFSQICNKFFFDFCLISESIHPWKITPVFYNNFSDFGGVWTFRRFPLPDPTVSPFVLSIIQILL